MLDWTIDSAYRGAYSVPGDMLIVADLGLLEASGSWLSLLDFFKAFASRASYEVFRPHQLMLSSYLS